MSGVELLKQNLPIEPDLQNFIGFVLTAAKQLGGNSFAASRASLALVKRLRSAGAASGYPLPVRLVLQDLTLSALWGDNNERFPIARLKEEPDADIVYSLQRQLQRSTEMDDPTLLLKRNLEMTQFFDEMRRRTEQELLDMQRTLEERQTELWETIRQAETDPLTGLLNRRSFDDKIDRAFKRTLRQKGECVSLALLDLDFFKQVNDEFGHQYGDAYLNKMGHIMREHIRTDVDFAFRIGGDEFALLLFSNETVACEKCLRILADMGHKVSIGIYSISGSDHEAVSMDQFFNFADKALYAAKESGRGRVMVSRCGHRPPEGCTLYCGEEPNSCL